MPARCRRYGAAVVVMAFDEKGQADTKERKVEICAARLRHPGQPGRLPGRGHHLRSQHLRRRDRHRGAQQLRRRLHRGDARDQAALPARQDLGRRLQPLLLLPRQRAGAQGDALGVPVPRHPGRHGHGHRQCRPARGLRPDPARAARGLRGRDPQPPRPMPPSGCSSWRPSTRAPARSAETPGRRMARAGRSRSGWSMRWSRAWTSSSSPTPRRRACRSRGRSR